MKEPKKILSRYSLKQKTAIVTGGVGVLGAYFCRGLAEAGAHVVVADLDQKKTRVLASDLMAIYDVKCLGVACDVSDPESVKEMVKQTVKEFGGVHVLHNNAATKSADLKAFFAPFEEYSLKEWRKVMSVNIDGMFLVAQAVGKQMRDQNQGGSIIQTASIYGLVAPDQRIYEGSNYLGGSINTPAVYAASKAAVVGLSKYLAAHWAPYKIRVNTLVPGGVESGQNETFIKRYSERVPMNRMGTPEEMVSTLLYLASDASSYVTGQSLVVDGGLTVW
jgi:NAD(P)-dependent dehydrogenase (short-subunit alcohol dehydrogenase family)